DNCRNPRPLIKTTVDRHGRRAAGRHDRGVLRRARPATDSSSDPGPRQGAARVPQRHLGRREGPMQGQLQRIVDALAARAGTPALLEDRGQRVLAYSEHTGPMDAVRRESILRRHATPEVIAWFRNAGIMEAREPLRTPACPELGLLPRVCVPVRHNDQLLGFVWFIDADGTLADTGIVDPGLMRELSLALYRQSLLGELASHREKEATRMLLDDNADVRAQAAQLLLEEGVVTDGDPTVALVALLATAPGRSHDDKARLALEQALAGTRRWLGTREALHL